MGFTSLILHWLLMNLKANGTRLFCLLQPELDKAADSRRKRFTS
jgi:hypothetical protein